MIIFTRKDFFDTLMAHTPKFTEDIFASKASVLDVLRTKLVCSKIEDLYHFTVSEWLDDQPKILTTIKNAFHSKYIVVRSSAQDEDSYEGSNAGSYESVLFVSPKSKRETKKAINKVIDSFSNKHNSNAKNQILVQSQSENIAISGVVFTKTEDGSPYYVINYDVGNLTDRVTKGEVNSTIKIFRNIKYIPKPWHYIIRSVREIESTLHNDTLDIEFGLTHDNTVIIFQARPLVFVTNKLHFENKISKSISQNKQKFAKLNSISTNGVRHTLFSDMSDWNPAEIIGDKPNLLDCSLYDLLVMKDAWRLGRLAIGYQDVSPLRLMVMFGNKPYVDMTSSFASMIPTNINKKLRKKLMKFYTDKIRRKPYLHDKVEFDVLFTCYDFTISKRLSHLSDNGFNATEIKQIRKNLVDFTNNIVEKFPEIEKECDSSCFVMIQKREQTISRLDGTIDPFILLDAAEQLLTDCKRHGTIQFSMMARIAFIASILLKSLVRQGKISPSQHDVFLESITTPVSDLRNDFYLFSKQKVSQDNLIKKYGHLRPGTYDITAPRYDENLDFMSSFKFLNIPQNKKFSKPNLSQLFSRHGLKFESIDFFDFVSTAISKREYLKFEFTHNLSDALELIARAGKILGFTRMELAHLDINTILSHKKLDKVQLKNKWRKHIDIQQKKKTINDHMHIPPIISSKHEFEIFSYFVTQPNFITRKKIAGNVAILNRNTVVKDISKKIIVIDSADPGFDWIFTKNIGGLITKYGGVASHMAIRCSELGIPAAIGCGDMLYEKLVYSEKVLLDCENKHVIVLKTKKKDPFLEEKKVLKSLGYIR